MKLLGNTLISGGHIGVADTSITRLKDKIREITKRNRGVSFSQIIDELNQVIIGWTNYFALANKWLSIFRDMDGYAENCVVIVLNNAGGNTPFLSSYTVLVS